MTNDERMKALEDQNRFFSAQMSKAADMIDACRVELEALRMRGDRIVDAFDNNDGTVGRALAMSAAVAAWRELQ